MVAAVSRLLDHAGDLVRERGVHQRAAGGEAVVEGADGHPRLLGDVLERNVEATASEGTASRRDQQVTVALRVPAQRPRLRHGPILTILRNTST